MKAIASVSRKKNMHFRSHRHMPITARLSKFETTVSQDAFLFVIFPNKHMKEACKKVVTQRWWRACLQHTCSQFQLRRQLKKLSRQHLEVDRDSLRTWLSRWQINRKAVHGTVIKAMLDSHTRDIEAPFKRGKEHNMLTAASQTLQPLPSQVGRLQSDVQQEPYA